VKKKSNENVTNHPCYENSQTLIQLAKNSSGWDKLSYMTDTFGPRFSGTQNLENAILWLEQQFKADGLENVKREQVLVPTWVRGNESAALISPRPKKLGMLGLGGSIATPPGGITAPVLVVHSFVDLETKCNSASGKIVLYNMDWVGYADTVVYRRTGAVAAAKCGAVASIIKSIGPYSLYTPHTGTMAYEATVPRIPAAAITLEDAEMIDRMIQRGDQVIIYLYMEAQTLSDSLSYNVMGEITGQSPHEVVVIGGHIDSWDVGQGAMDDGGGVVVSWEAVHLITQIMKEQGRKPLRTVRVVGWTNEENGARGAAQYRDNHLNETHIFAFESDGGITTPFGIGFTGSDEARSILKSIGNLLFDVGSTQVFPSGGGVDIDPLIQDGVPGASLEVDREKYFWYHHTEADTMDKINPQDLKDCVATMAVFAFCVADSSVTLPR